MRLDQLLYDFESQKQRVPYVAIIKEDGSVKVRHSQRNNIEFTDEAAFRSWIADNNLDESGNLRVIIVNERNCQGEKPKEI